MCATAQRTLTKIAYARRVELESGQAALLVATVATSEYRSSVVARPQRHGGWQAAAGMASPYPSRPALRRVIPSGCRYRTYGEGGKGKVGHVLTVL